MNRAAWFLLALASCLQAGDQRCADGVVCPIDRVCAAGGCALPEQVAACGGLLDGAPCTFAGTSGTCAGGVCVGSLCGNGAIDDGEICDDGNASSGDGCRRDCLKLERCGDAVIDVAEACDDGNADAGDGCGATCQIEACGNGVLDPGELCDDGNNAIGDGCSADCRSDERCGNGFLDASRGETCDDGDRRGQDGCSSTCENEAPRWRRLQAGPPPGRQTSASAYDAGRARFVLFGGRGATTVLSDLWEFDGARWMQRDPTSGPAARADTAMAYDAARKTVVLFGGSNGSFLADTWGWNGARWTPLSSPTSPGPRAGHAMAYDAARQRIVMFGGLGAGGTTAETWEWDGASWMQRTPAMSPPPRWRASMAFDPRRGRIVLFGGADASPYDDTWEWDGTSWANVTPAPPASPSPRSRAAMAYDAGLEAVVLVSSGAPYDTWAWNGTTWSNVTPASQPANRDDLTAAYDIARKRIVVFSGRVGTTLNSSTYDWDGAAYAEFPGAVLPPVSDVVTAYDPRRGVGLMHDAASTTWAWNGRAWSLVATASAPPPRLEHALAFDRGRDEYVLAGGCCDFDFGNYYADQWVLAAGTWVERTSTGAIAGTQLVYDPKHDHVVLFGGEAHGTHAWDGTTWTEVASVLQSPPSRYFTGLAYDAARERVVMFGGTRVIESFGYDLGDTWEWDGTAWIQQATLAAPAPRASHALAYDPGRRTTVLFGGTTPSVLTDTWEWDGTIWTSVSTSEAPMGLAAQRTSHSMIYDARNQNLFLDGRWVLRYESSRPHEVCEHGADVDGDGLVGCTDPDCWGYCSPLCPPGTQCSATAPRCGDGSCNLDLETCRLCPDDCGACTASCGDMFCDPPETAATCPGDCS